VQAIAEHLHLEVEDVLLAAVEESVQPTAGHEQPGSGICLALGLWQRFMTSRSV
jgi:hypothetical protein